MNLDFSKFKKVSSIHKTIITRENHKKLLQNDRLKKIIRKEIKEKNTISK